MQVKKNELVQQQEINTLRDKIINTDLWLKTNKTIDEIRNLIQQGDPKIIGMIQNKIKEHSEKFYQCSQFDDNHTDWASE